ncbi:hypothetical protein Lac1_06900 [Claveliimonas bilis]|uniref:Uncharacterized protein n=1 Tax=Claveliimonas bilis TaxID=3028070 RepID=A0ABM8I619_9FIRM|nr:hypothetical protein Lac1_06900 [Claveliimonas bilis]
MDKVSDRLTVFFEEPFWVGVLSEAQRENYRRVRLRLERSREIMRSTSLF